MINQQVSLASQVLKNPKANNAQHVLEIVKLNDFDIEETKVAKRQPLKRLKKTLLSLEASEKKNKQGIETHEEDNQTNPKKTVVDLLDQRTTKNIQLQVMLSRNTMGLQKREKLLKQHIRAFCV